MGLSVIDEQSFFSSVQSHLNGKWLDLVLLANSKLSCHTAKIIIISLIIG